MGKKSYGQHATKSCGGEYDQLFNEENLPYLKCEKCGHEVTDWIQWHKKYKFLHLEEEAWNRPADSISVLLGYFTSRYEEIYKVPYVLSLTSTGLFRGSEAVFIRRILGALNNDTAQVKAYMDWVFTNKVIDRKKKITSLSFLTVPNQIQLFKFQQEKDKKFHRDMPLPPAMIQWVNDKIPGLLDKAQLTDFGDLQNLLKHHKNGYLAGDSEMHELIQQLYKKKLVDNELNLRDFE